MKIHNKPRHIRLAVLLLALLISSCTTIDYRGVQSQFEQAIQLDNGRSVSAFTETSVFTEPGYDGVLSQLTPEYISSLDDRLQPNAWLLRSVSQWRTGKLQAARQSATNGLAETQLQKQSRDHVLLLMIPALVIDMEIEKNWKQAGKKYTPEQYARAGKDYVTVFDTFKSAEQAMGTATPMSIRYYLSYQKWRVIQGWRTVINSIDTGNDQASYDAQNAALKEAAKNFEGRSLKDAAKTFESSIPAGNALRDLIAAQS